MSGLQPLCGEISPAKPCKSSLREHSADMHIGKKLRLLFYSLAFLEIILLTAYEAWGKVVLR
jgi:hypothetical protein